MEAGAVEPIADEDGVARAIRWLIVLALAVAAGMIALGGVVLLDARQDAWRQAEQSSRNLITALSRDIARTLSVYDLSLQGTVEVMREPGLDSLSPALRRAALFDRSAGAEYLGSLLVIDSFGRVLHDSTATEPHRLNVLDRDYFVVQRRSEDAGLYISRSFASRLRPGDPIIAMSRRISNPDGSFGGIVVGTLRLAYFEDLFSNLDLGAYGAVTLMRPDGQVLVRKPMLGQSTGYSLADTPELHRMQSSPRGSFVQASPIDSVQRLVLFEQINGFPLIIAVGLSVDDIYASWWHKAVGIGLLLAILCAAMVVLCVLFRREILWRMATERALVRTADKLSVMAATDELTGLSNRRAFEQELEAEWRRAIRNGTSVAVLMVDADWFKPFNDHYGHQAGDMVLTKVSSVIQQAIRRPGDVAARYGGEEFVVLLPDTELTGAINTAQRICAAVADLRIDHVGSPLGHVTISLGAAVAAPRLTGFDRDLVQRADAALYEAKRAGRARVCASEPGRSPITFPPVGHAPQTGMSRPAPMVRPDTATVPDRSREG